MFNRILILAVSALLSLLLLFPLSALASSVGLDNMSTLITYIEKAQSAKDLDTSKQAYDQYKEQWLKLEDSIKSDSTDAYKAIESQMGQAEYAYMTNISADVNKALLGLHNIAKDYLDGKYASSNDFDEKDITLSDFVIMLKQIKETIHNQDQVKAIAAIQKVRDAWLSVEGHVVAQSSSAYNDSERDLVVIQAMLTKSNFDSAEKTITNMISYLTPLSEKTAYTFWDAAMIPIREGLEALLVVGALLAFVRKSKSRDGKKWVISGVGAGLLLSIALAFVIKFVLSSGAFGQNNFLITGWTGVFAAVMLLYMSYWLHSNSNIQQWNQYIKSKTEFAMSTGKMITLGTLSFLAVFREGTETVLFIIGMINQISFQDLMLGILIGFGFLAFVAFLMLYVGIRLPIRPFFLVSSFIVLYLCIKFMGMGIHSLQLAGVMPVSNSDKLPNINFFAFYPSWQSAAPQLAIALIAILFLFIVRIRNKSKANISTT
ncbi:FTR1 family iron permease [Paenibacillus kobensis]|uniref:FTR1 family iron permease n=1 Tax=Paenibacillus kobensis TaxID=59841 RepID=UPI000FD85C55|nr:FTR1 family protein [Paenibacillus kobensis]